MIRVAKVSEPPGFPQVKLKGNEWLAKYPDAAPSEFPDYWSQLRPELARGFEEALNRPDPRLRRRS